MRCINQIATRSLVFSKWSRKAYAVFISLKRVVNIAQLSVDICTVSLLKIKSLILGLLLPESVSFDCKDEDDDGCVAEKILHAFFFEIKIQVSEIPACFSVEIKNMIHMSPLVASVQPTDFLNLYTYD